MSLFNLKLSILINAKLSLQKILFNSYLGIPIYIKCVLCNGIPLHIDFVPCCLQSAKSLYIYLFI